MYRTQYVTDGLGLGLFNDGECGDVDFLEGTNRPAEEAFNCGNGDSAKGLDCRDVRVYRVCRVQGLRGEMICVCKGAFSCGTTVMPMTNF